MAECVDCGEEFYTKQAEGAYRCRLCAVGLKITQARTDISNLYHKEHKRHRRTYNLVFITWASLAGLTLMHMFGLVPKI